jgi:hypothetical protein
MTRFVGARLENVPSLILLEPEEPLETHMMVFAAEKARRENRVVAVVVDR